MSFLLDTNVLSEWTRPRPNSGVVAWLADADEDRLFISVITLAELRRGIERLAAGARRRRLEEWFHTELLDRFESRVLPIDPAIADGWGRLMAQHEVTGRRMGTMDAFIAATCIAHEMTLVTRNVGDFRDVVEAILDPWTV